MLGFCEQNKSYQIPYFILHIYPFSISPLASVPPVDWSLLTVSGRSSGAWAGGERGRQVPAVGEEQGPDPESGAGRGGGDTGYRGRGDWGHQPLPPHRDRAGTGQTHSEIFRRRRSILTPPQRSSSYQAPWRPPDRSRSGLVGWAECGSVSGRLDCGVIPPYSQSSHCQTRSPRHWPTLKWILIADSINILFNTLKCRRGCCVIHFPSWELHPRPAPSLYFAKINYDTAVAGWLRLHPVSHLVSDVIRRLGTGDNTQTRGVNHKAEGCGLSHYCGPVLTLPPPQYFYGSIIKHHSGPGPVVRSLRAPFPV